MRLPRGDRGSAAVELALVMPLLLAMLSLVYGYGRVAQVSGTLEAGTRDAARSASQARSALEAEQVAESAVLTSLNGVPQRCLDTLDVGLRGGLFRSGFPVTVTARCSYSLADLLPGVPGSLQAASSFTSPLDPNRGVR